MSRNLGNHRQVAFFTQRLSTPLFEMQTPRGWGFSLVIPSNYSLKTVPDHIDPSIQIAEIPESLIAVNEFRGQLSESTIARLGQELRIWLLEMGNYTTPMQPFIAYKYLFPMFPFLRRTEVMLHLELKRAV